jgi:integrase
MMRSGSQSGPGRAADQQRGQETSTGIVGSRGAAAAGAAHLRRLGRGADLPDFVAMMLATGLRIGECAALRWENVDLNASNGHRHVHGGAAEGPRIKRQIDEKPGGDTHACPAVVVRADAQRAVSHRSRVSPHR